MDYPRFDRASPHTPLTEAELQQLDDWLIGLAEAGVDGVMTLDGMDGYLTALAVGPSKVLDELPTADWLPAIWGGDGPNGAPFPSNQKRKRTTVLVLRHLQSIASVLRAAPAGWEPVFSVVEHEGTEWADAGDWCTGFLQATDLDPAAWEPLFEDPVLGPQLVPIALLGGDADRDGDAEDDLDDPDVRDELSRGAAQAVLALVEHAKP
jgi:uncharacterized protein